MKQFLKILVGVVILGVIGFCVYGVLPEYPQNLVKSLVQPVINSQAKERISAVKNLKNSDVDATYQTILESHTNNNFWVYEINEATGVETVTFYGSGAHISVKELKGHEDMLYTSCQVKFEFVITGNKVEIIAYIDGEKQDDDVKGLMIQQLLAGN